MRKRIAFILKAVVARRLARFGFRRIPLPPQYLAGGIGLGDFEKTGREMVELARRLGRLKPWDVVLDLGCGLGRLAQPLREYLGPRGRYHGVDVVRKYVEWDTMMIEARDPRFWFHHIDAANSEYNPEGTVRAESVVLPFAPASFSFVLAISLFTHLSERAASNYLREVARVLKPGGRLFATFFVLDEQAEAQMAQGRTDVRFQAGTSRSRSADLAIPEKAIAFSAEWLRREFRAAGLSLPGPPVRGAWTGLPGAPAYHDVLVATREQGEGARGPRR